MQSLILLIFLFDLKNYTNVRNEEISFQVNVVIKFKGLIINKSIIKINHLKKFKNSKLLDRKLIYSNHICRFYFKLRLKIKQIPFFY